MTVEYSAAGPHRHLEVKREASPSVFCQCALSACPAWGRCEDELVQNLATEMLSHNQTGQELISHLLVMFLLYSHGALFPSTLLQPNRL